MRKQPDGSYRTADDIVVRPLVGPYPGAKYRVRDNRRRISEDVATLADARKTIRAFRMIRDEQAKRTSPTTKRKRRVRRKRKPIDEQIAIAEKRVAEWRRKRKLADTKLAGWERKLDGARRRKIAALEARAREDEKKIRAFRWDSGE